MSVHKQNNSGWFTWEVQPRNRSMSASLGVDLYEFTSKRPRSIKYIILLAKTLSAIFSKKISVIYTQNPSIVLSFVAVCLKLCLRRIVIVDAHNAGIYPLEGKHKFLNLIARFIARNANLVIVSNKYLAEQVTNWGGTPFVFPDPIPPIANHPTQPPLPAGENFALFICTWAADEPYFEVIKAAELTPDIAIYVTGNYKNKLTQDTIKSLPNNVRLLGFVSEEEYVHYFSNALVAIDLTTRDHCLVCGAYEAAALGVPAILSDSKVNRDIFNKGFIYTSNNAHDIAISIQTAVSQRQSLATEIKQFKQSHNQLIDSLTLELKHQVNKLQNES